MRSSSAQEGYHVSAPRLPLSSYSACSPVKITPATSVDCGNGQPFGGVVKGQACPSYAFCVCAVWARLVGVSGREHACGPQDHAV